MQVYSYDKDGYYQGETWAQPSPLEAGKFLLPANATVKKPKNATKNKENKWDGSKWVLVTSREYLKQKAIEKMNKLAETNEWGVKLYQEADNDLGYEERDPSIIADEIEDKKYDRLVYLVQEKSKHELIIEGTFKQEFKTKALAKKQEIDQEIANIDK